MTSCLIYILCRQVFCYHNTLRLNDPPGTNQQIYLPITCGAPPMVDLIWVDGGHQPTGGRIGLSSIQSQNERVLHVLVLHLTRRSPDLLKDPTHVNESLGDWTVSGPVFVPGINTCFSVVHVVQTLFGLLLAFFSLWLSASILIFAFMVSCVSWSGLNACWPQITLILSLELFVLGFCHVKRTNEGQMFYTDALLKFATNSVFWLERNVGFCTGRWKIWIDIGIMERDHWLHLSKAVFVLCL